MSKKNNKNNKNNLWGVVSQFGKNIIGTLLIFVIIISLYSGFAEQSKKTENISISALALDIKSGLVKKITVEGENIYADYQDEKIKVSQKELESSLSQTLINYGVTAEELSKVEIAMTQMSGVLFWLLNLAPFVIPIIFIFVLFWIITSQIKGSSMQAFSFGQSKARMIDPNDEKQKVLFKDVAGVKEAKEELKEIVDFLKSPKKFIDIGAKIPKGVLLMGAPGTGKTLLARAVAGEANVPFLYLSGSEFVEMFVGVGASRVRDLFKLAKKAAPAIIFIDEIDAVARHRGTGMGGGNDEREQTLNQILVEMDGFEPNEKVIIMAATNRPDVLDQALLRPGRFDRRVTLDLPDVKDREEIMKIHAKGKPFAEDVNLKVISERTPGFSGADLANVVNEASILAAREDRKTVGQYDLIRSVEKVMLGPERKSHILSDKEKNITSYHEMGHAIIASILPDSDPVHKVSIISRGRAAGYTLKLPFEEKRLHSKKQFLDDIAVSLGGYAAEKMIFGDITTGASNDIAVSTALARDMVTRFGMSDTVGPVDFGSTTHEGVGVISHSHSEEFAANMDREVSKIMNEALVRAQNVLSEQRKALDNMSAELKKVETLERQDFENLLILNGIKPKEDGNNPDTPGQVIAEI
ncbi:MAG: Lysyl-tRNA synthetase [Parcubacteria group bacterium GW2011_GWF2_38_76]|nr:MAG: Lysyl-tRNA synthetase [Parcubacteria group bacterium GW2011_GWF2_38_76]HBM45365.1 cell division protein FtsH [Patescibacteria group bacterium]